MKDLSFACAKWIKGPQLRRGFVSRLDRDRLSLEMLLHKPDILFVPAHIFPYFTPKKSYITVHDVAYEKYPIALWRFSKFTWNGPLAEPYGKQRK